MNNSVITYLSNIFKYIDVPEKDIQSYSEKIFLITLDAALAEIATPEEISKLEQLIKVHDEAGVNSFLLSLPGDKLQPVFIAKLQENLQSFIASIANEYNKAERTDLIKKLEQLASIESLNQYKSMTPNDFLKSISK